MEKEFPPKMNHSKADKDDYRIIIVVAVSCGTGEEA
jgi:hypothetical protein